MISASTNTACKHYMERPATVVLDEAPAADHKWKCLDQLMSVVISLMVSTSGVTIVDILLILPDSDGSNVESC